MPRRGRTRALLILALFSAARTATAAPPGALDEAALAYARGKYQAAAEILQSASPSDSPSLTLLGLSLRRLKREHEAILPLSQALQSDPKNLDAGLNLGLAYFSEGDWGSAQAAFESAAKGNPLSPAPWLGLGMLEGGRRDWAAAQKKYEEALALDPAKSGAWLSLSDSLLQQGKAREAAEARQKAAALIQAKDPELHFKQAALWYGLGEIEKASQDFDASGAGSEPEALFLKGCLSYRKGQLEEAEAFFKAALEAKSDYNAARINLGISRYGRGDFAGAVQSFQEALDQEPKNSGAAEYLASAREAAVDHELRAGSQAVLDQDFPKALAAWERARALSDEPAAIARLINSLRQEQAPQARALAASGDEALAQGRLEEALELWSQALQIDPENPEAKAGLKRAESRLEPLKDALIRSAEAAAARGEFRQAEASVARLKGLDGPAAKITAAKIQASEDLEIKRLESGANADLAAARYGPALAALDQSIALAPGRVRLQAKRREALASQRQALALKLAEAQKLEEAGKAAEALKAAAEALAVDDGDLEARRLIARLSSSLKISQAGTHEAHRLYYEGVYAYGYGKTRQALELWLQAQKFSPGDPLLAASIKSARTKLKSLAELKGARP